MYASVAISSDLFEVVSCAIFIFNSLLGIFNAAIRFFRACKLGCPGSCSPDVFLVVVAFVVVVLLEEEDCANAAVVFVVIENVFDIEGIAIKLRIRPNIPI
jgi:hypothetical protein